ncbi:Hypothetical protein NTJ_12437 [Nesidiocoris tenuis]|uniref:Uncharacterized protein n=1 Tax=Nesidiocoris tenuis TaxID=355587 RepID=A0ABN7B5C9_9HEMI|nr:Hypothetical protein NTJ_12437 [Nesidiocoris tenuis]
MQPYGSPSFGIGILSPGNPAALYWYVGNAQALGERSLVVFVVLPAAARALPRAAPTSSALRSPWPLPASER